MKKLALLAFVALLGGIPVTAGCAHPYSGKPENLRRPKAKKVPEKADEPPADPGQATPGEDQCRTNFFADPFKGRRNSRDALNLARQANGILLDAERLEGDRRRAMVLDAMSKLGNALKRDPYGPEPTYKYAVAYALAGRKACALAFLDRLNALQSMPAVEKEAGRAIQRALRDPAFEPFRREADSAMGQ